MLSFIGIAGTSLSYFLRNIYTLVKYYLSNDLVFLLVKKKFYTLDIPYFSTISFYNLWKLAIFNVTKNCCWRSIKFIGTI